MRLPLLFLLLTLCFSITAQTTNEPSFEHDVETDAKPWSHLEFNNDPYEFQFAIVSDNTGGARPGVFHSAIMKLNLMQPEFVMSVGDLIEGYTEDMDQVESEWVEFNGWIEELQMPFFYVPGNHDITNSLMQADWEERYGVRYFSFVYKDVLFIMMDTDDDLNPAWYKVTEEQENYVLSVLEKHRDVRWTLFFMHHPLWTQDDNELSVIEEKLKVEGRDYTMFAGHVHHYMEYERQGNQYYTLGTTGGGSPLRGPRFGEFDHVTWVTLKRDGPVMANLELSGILDMDINTPEIQELSDALTNASSFDELILTNSPTEFETGRILFSIENTSEKPVAYRSQFFHHHQLILSESDFEFTVEPGGRHQIDVDLNVESKMAYEDIGLLRLNWEVQFEDSPYPELKLTGTNDIEIRPTEIKYLDPVEPIYLDKYSASADHPWEGIEMHYSDNGEAVSDNSPVFSDPIQIEKGDLKLAIQLIDENGLMSGIEEKEIHQVKLAKAVTLKKAEKGLEYKAYLGEWNMLPDFSKLKPSGDGLASNFGVESLADAEDNYGLVFKGFVQIEEEGIYTFFTYSDDGSKLYIHGEEVVDNDGIHSPKLERGYYALEPGYHPIEIHYFDKDDYERLWVGYQAPSMSRFKSLSFDYLAH